MDRVLKFAKKLDALENYIRKSSRFGCADTEPNFLRKRSIRMAYEGRGDAVIDRLARTKFHREWWEMYQMPGSEMVARRISRLLVDAIKALGDVKIKDILRVEFILISGDYIEGRHHE